MNVFHGIDALNTASRPACLAIGVFDGVHLGHQQVIRQAVGDAAQHGGAAVVITFDRHPNAVVAPDRVPPLIYPLAKKLRMIESLGVETACVVHFDKAFSQIAGEDFVRDLWRRARPIQSISVGGTFTFGHRRSGNVALLEKLGKELNFGVHGLAEVSLDGPAVSSTRVRESVADGRFDLAARMLGRPYALCGNVAKGIGLGRKIGVPTANLDLTGLVLPPTGVYAARALIQRRTHLAAVNVGFRPTVEAAAPRPEVEAHLLDFAEDIYGEEMELTFLARLRPEQKFDSIAAMRDQIFADIQRVRTSA